MRKVKNRYNDIKLAKGLYLDNVAKTDRNGELGISTILTGSKWFILPKGRAIFKSYDGSFYQYIKDLRIANELLCQELAKQLNIDCAEYQPAIYENKKGLVSYDVTKNGEELLNGNYLFALSKSNQNYPINDFNSYITSLKSLKQQGYNFDLKQQIVNLYKIAVFDSLTAQSDRHISNVFFIVNKKEKTLKVAPLIDNEFAFNIENESATLYYNYYVKKSDINKNLNRIHKQLEINDLSSTFHNKYDANLQNIVNLAKNNPTLKQVLDDMLSKYNLKDAIDSLEKQGTTISQSYKEYILNANKVIMSKYKKAYSNKQKNTQQDFLEL